MRQIVYLLSGTSAPPPLLDRQIDRFLQKMRDEVEDIIWTASFNESGHAAGMLEAYQALDARQRARFFLSPSGFEAVFSAIWSATDQRLVQLEDGLKSVRARSDEAADQAWPVEKVIPGDANPERLVLGETITVDIGSEDCRRVDITSPVFAHEFQELSNEEANTVREKLLHAMTEIESIAPTLARLIRNYTRVVYIRKAEGQLPSSEQVDSELGAIRLLNVHTEAYNQGQVVDDLIHESIHNLLGTFEYLEFPFVPVGYKPSNDLRPVSPWSMRAIQLVPFLHAAFVYFGMLNYADLALKRDDLREEQRRSLLQRRNRYASGFLMPGRLSDFALAIGQADPRVLVALDWMQNTVRSKYGFAGLPQVDVPLEFEPGSDVSPVSPEVDGLVPA